MYFYDLQKKTFLVSGVHQIPANAIAVSEKEFTLLVEGRNKGREIVLMGNTLTLSSVRPSTYHTWTGTTWSISDENKQVLLSQQRQQIRDDINTLRDRKINGGIYVPAIDKWIDSDARAERNLLSTKASFDLFGDELDITWTCADNTTIKLTKEIMLHIWQALLHNKQTNHANAFLHKNAVDQSETPLEYDFSGGWTQTYEDFTNEQK